MKSEKEKMLIGENYFGNDKELVLDRQKAKKLLHKLNVTEYLMNGNARQILRELLPNSNKRIYIEPPFHCDYGYNIQSGENVYFNVNCVVLDSMKVTIGDNVFFGPNCQIYTATHPLDIIERQKIEFSKQVFIGNDCWIGGSPFRLGAVYVRAQNACHVCLWRARHHACHFHGSRSRGDDWSEETAATGQSRACTRD